MVGAAKQFARISLPRRTKLRAPVRATIIENIDIAVMVAGHHHRLPTDPRQVVIARIRDLAFMSNIDPLALEYPFHLKFENIGVHIGQAMHSVRLDHGGEFTI